MWTNVRTMQTARIAKYICNVCSISLMRNIPKLPSFLLWSTRFRDAWICRDNIYLRSTLRKEVALHTPQCNNFYSSKYVFRKLCGCHF